MPDEDVLCTASGHHSSTITAAQAPATAPSAAPAVPGCRGSTRRLAYASVAKGQGASGR